MAAARGHLELRTRTLADTCDLRSAVPDRVPVLHMDTSARPRPVAYLSRWREADGVRLPQRHPAQPLYAALRSMVQRGLYQLLLLWAIPGGRADQVDRHCSSRRVQSGAAAALWDDVYGRVLGGGRADAPLVGGSRRRDRASRDGQSGWPLAGDRPLARHHKGPDAAQLRLLGKQPRHPLHHQRVPLLELAVRRSACAPDRSAGDGLSDRLLRLAAGCDLAPGPSPERGGE